MKGPVQMPLHSRGNLNYKFDFISRDFGERADWDGVFGSNLLREARGKQIITMRKYTVEFKNSIQIEKLYGTFNTLDYNR